MSKWSKIFKIIKISLRIEQKLEEIGIVPQNKIDDVVVELVDRRKESRKENNSSNP